MTGVRSRTIAAIVSVKGQLHTCCRAGIIYVSSAHPGDSWGEVAGPLLARARPRRPLHQRIPRVLLYRRARDTAHADA